MRRAGVRVDAGEPRSRPSIERRASRTARAVRGGHDPGRTRARTASSSRLPRPRTARSWRTWRSGWLQMLGDMKRSEAALAPCAGNLLVGVSRCSAIRSRKPSISSLRKRPTSLSSSARRFLSENPQYAHGLMPRGHEGHVDRGTAIIRLDTQLVVPPPTVFHTTAHELYLVLGQRDGNNGLVRFVVTHVEIQDIPRPITPEEREPFIHGDLEASGLCDLAVNSRISPLNRVMPSRDNLRSCCIKGLPSVDLTAGAGRMESRLRYPRPRAVSSNSCCIFV